MMGWMAALRHLSAKMLVDSITSERDRSIEFRLQQQAGHMTGSDCCAARKIICCKAGAIHT